MLRAIIVDDEPLSVKRLHKILSDSGEVEICKTFLNPISAYDFVKQNPIDIAFLDIGMSEINGMRLSSMLHDLDNSIDVVFVTAYDNYAVQAFQLSALDYLLKPITIQRVSMTLDKIRKRRYEAVEPPRIVIAKTPDKDNEHLEKLTEQEMKVLALVAEGFSNKEIAIRMKITGETVKFHMKNVYRKLEVNNRVRALQRARELRILD